MLEKCMYSYVARQPILDRELKTHAYELLFRDSLDNVFPHLRPAGHLATGDGAIPATEHRSAAWRPPCFINFPHSLLLDGLAECLPQDKVVIEILEDAEPDDALLDKVISSTGWAIGWRWMISPWSRPGTGSCPISTSSSSICGPHSSPA